MSNSRKIAPRELKMAANRLFRRFQQMTKSHFAFLIDPRSTRKHGQCSRTPSASNMKITIENAHARQPSVSCIPIRRIERPMFTILPALPVDICNPLLHVALIGISYLPGKIFDG